jgi:hypothetical protein
VNLITSAGVPRQLHPYLSSSSRKAVHTALANGCDGR